MKTLTFHLLLIVAITMVACKKEKLTKETQEGANTFSCKINGKVFMPKQELFGPAPLYAQVDTFNGKETMSISASNPNTFIQNMHFVIENFKGIGVYDIATSNGIYVDSYLKVSSPNLQKAESGFIRITKYQDKILSGTFEFNLKNGSQNIAVIAGRFDITLR
jgi:hypothetical protein